MTFDIEYEYEKKLPIEEEIIAGKVIEAVLDYESCPYEVEVHLLIISNEEMKKINKEQRGIDEPTDVLSFPMADYKIPGDFQELENHGESYFHPDTGELILGDILLSGDKVIEQAEKYGHSIEREFAFLIAHSMLHLCGYDHMTKEDSEKMEKKQKEILNILKIYR